MKQNFDEDEECFISANIEEEMIPMEKKQHSFHLDRSQLPFANELRQSKRPIKMVSRTIFTAIKMSFLPPALNEPCQEFQEETISKRKLKIVNPSRLQIAEFLNHEQFVLIYSKYKKQRKEGSSYSKTSRIIRIKPYNDYDQKQFSQFNENEQIHNASENDTIDSNFQSGNLFYAYRLRNQKQYYLLLENDVNTHGYSNWFFFRVRNSVTGVRRFHIINIVKNTSMYRYGMKIAIFSMKRFQKEKKRWSRGGDNITFAQTNFSRQYHPNERYSSLSFQYDFTHEEDQIYFALNTPYTYTRMINILNSFQEGLKVDSALKCQIKQIGYSISSNIIPALSIFKGNENQKPIVMIMGRQHPSQTVGSFVVEGILDQFKKESLYMDFLLSNYIFIVIPFVNPDGVIHGNSRCNLAGLDLNRNWALQTLKDISPQTVKIRNFIAELQGNGHQIQYLIDVHGHGKKD